MITTVNEFQPKFLTPEQRSFVDQLITKLEGRKYNARVVLLHQLTREILGIKWCPKWIIRNETIMKPDRRRDITKLLSLPVREARATDRERRKKFREEILKKKNSIQKEEQPKVDMSNMSVEQILRHLHHDKKSR